MIDISQYVKLPQSFYTRPNVVEISRDLIGKYLFTQIEGELTGGKILETEAYDGRKDKACHAFLKRTKRTEVMYENGGIAYIYLCYGIHHLFNIVTNKNGLADAILIRAIEPLVGEDLMRSRRNNARNIASGPGVLSQSLSLHKELTGIDLTGDQVWIAQNKNDQLPQIETDVRIGIDYAGEDALLPWRFLWKDHPLVSVPKKKAPNR